MSEKRPPVDDDEAIRKAALERGEGVLRDQVPRRLSLAEREKMRRVLGVDPGGDVALHTGPAASAAAEAMEAKAFTLGSKDIYFKEGAYQPETVEGQALLAHELTHVLEDVSGASKEGGVDETERTAAETRAERTEKAVREAAHEVEKLSLDTAQKERLVEKVVKIIERQQRQERERRGRR